MSNLLIYKASAGSGKTYTITREFIELLFANPLDYKHLLAVTFTNKATAEMKGRIIKTLYDLWREPIEGNKPNYMELLIKSEGSEAKVRTKAAFILHLLLHDFSRFSVSTIDSFFQKIIRSFMQELGLHSGIKTELSQTKVMQKAVDGLIMELGEPNKKDLRDWLIKSSQENMDDGKSWDITEEITSLGYQVFSEIYQSFPLETIEKLNNKALLEQIKLHLTNETKQFEKQVIDFGKKGKTLMSQCGVTYDDLPQKSRTPFKILDKMVAFKTEYHDVSKVEKFINNLDIWLNKKEKTLHSKIIDLYHTGLNKLLIDYKAFIDENIKLHNTYVLILKNLNALAIINDLANQIDKICSDDSIFLLSNANRLLYKVIGNNDTPFVYEKSGTVYKHFMVDEFQDTSSLQWQNLKPLIENGLSANNFAMLVGDVKQSIYRWRNSDWKLLANQVENEFTILGTSIKTLDTNWRSNENIINFNNAFFSLAANSLQDIFNSNLEDLTANDSLKWSSTITNAYNDIHQKVQPKNIGTGGYIQIDFINDIEKNVDELIIDKAMEMVQQVLALGSAYKDICILVSSAKEARLVTNALLSGHKIGTPCPVVSNEALMLSASIAVKTVVNQLKYILNPYCDIYNSYVLLYNQHLSQNELPETIDANTVAQQPKHNQELLALKGMPLIDLIEFLIQRIPQERLLVEGVFLQAFKDAATSYIKNNPADLAHFIEWWNEEGINQSVSVPEQQDAIRVMTIHKSKGLEFEHVIMPFLDWDLNSLRHTKYLWCKNPIGVIDYVPIKYDKKMLKSSFENDYLNELLHQYVDKLNMLYVAFTRAKQSIQGVIPMPKPKKDENSLLNSVSELILSTLSTNTEAHFGKDVILNENGFTLGKLQKTTNKHDNDETEEKEKGDFKSRPLPIMKSWSYVERVKIFMESENFIDASVPNRLQQGKIMHKLFELIGTVNDIETSVNKLVLDGLIERSKREATINYITKLLNEPPIANWFAPTTKFYNETSILLKNNSLRPDRVVIDNNKTIVIDYKFGEQHTPDHISQVESYISIMAQMGYKNIEGYIWYVIENVIKEVPYSNKLF